MTSARGQILKNADVLPARCGDLSLRVNEAEGIHVPKSIARKPALNSHRKLASVLPKFGENTPEKGATTGKGHTKFLARLL